MIASGGELRQRCWAVGLAAAAVGLATLAFASSAFATITYQSQWGGPGPGALVHPHGVAMDPSGNVYVSDRDTDELQVFDSTGDFVTEWGGTGTAAGKFNTLDSVAVVASGTTVNV